MKSLSRPRLIAAAALAFGLLGVGSAAQARTDVQFSIGLPGVYVGPQPVYVQPQPVYVQPEPAYVAPATVYVRPARSWWEERELRREEWRHRHWREREWEREHRGHRHWD